MSKIIASMLLSLAMASSAYAQSSPVNSNNIQTTRNGVVYTVSQNETLSSISQKFTGHIKHWRSIGQLNQIDNDRTIPVGRKVLIPTKLLTPVSTFAKVKSFFGEVIIRAQDGSNIETRIDTLLKEGDTLTTLANSFISLMLDDGTQFTLPPNSAISLKLLRATQYIDSPKTQIFLQKGRVESHVTPFNRPESRYEVISPLAVSGVRGTNFRVTADTNKVLNEVIEGKVAVEQSTVKTKPSKQLLAAGYGAIVENGRVNKPVALLAAPTLLDGYQEQRRLPIQFALAHPTATAFHVTISIDAAGQNNIAETSVNSTSGKATAKLENLEDGDYFVRYSALDASGLEGLPGTQAFRVNARPFPPFLLQPGAKFQGIGKNERIPVTMQWSQVSGVSDYRLQVATDAAFGAIVVDQSTGINTDQSVVMLASGTYYWRVASIIKNGNEQKQGPYGDAKKLEVIQGLPAPVANVHQKNIHFSWSAAPGQRFTFQVADTPAFTKLLHNIETTQAETSIPRPDAGTYYARVRSTDVDGFIGTFSPAQKFIIQTQWTSGDGTPVESLGQPIRTNF